MLYGCKGIQSAVLWLSYYCFSSYSLGCLQVLFWSSYLMQIKYKNSYCHFLLSIIGASITFKDIFTELNSALLLLPLWCRTLSSSDDVQDRETEKGRLEEAFETCDRDLDQQIVQHYAELTTAIRTYQSITERITSSRNKIKQVEKGETCIQKCTVDKWIRKVVKNDYRINAFIVSGGFQSSDFKMCN